MKSQVLMFGENSPDQPALGASVTVAKNCIPQAQSYRAARDLSALSDALDGTALASIWAQASDENYYIFAGDATKLYQLNMSTTNWANVSQAGNYTATDWAMAQWGDRVIAVSKDEATQYFDMGTSTLFADLAGSPPKAKCIGVVRDFVVLGNVDDGTNRPNRVVWSGFNNSELWTPSLATQSDYQDLQGRGGAIQAIVPGEYGLIFQEFAITRMTYQGPPTIFRFDEVSRDRGTNAPKSVCWQGTDVYFWATDGFYHIGANGLEPIGNEKIDRFVANDFDTSMPNKFQGKVDIQKKLVVWTYPSLELNTQRMVVYRWDLGRWATIDLDVKLLAESKGFSFNLDTLDILLDDIDSDSFPIDSSLYSDAPLYLGGFDSDNKLGIFAGSRLTGTIETGEFSAPNGKRVNVTSVRPISDGTVTLYAGTRDNQNDTYSYGTGKTENTNGEFDFRTSSRYHRFKASISGAFEHAQGIEIFYREEGRR